MDERFVRKLNIAGAVSKVVDGHLDRMPPLIADRCLVDAKSTLTESVVADAIANSAIPVETLTMPRRLFGVRPVGVTSAGHRALYAALVEALGDRIPQARTRDDYDAYERFGAQDPFADGYLVELDIASCYEYIDHELLHLELVSRTSNVPAVAALMDILGRWQPRGRGLPQLNESSDALADAYLEILERDLLRVTPTVMRVADDFKIERDDWATANEVIEYAAEEARRLGLVLSTEKTRISAFDTVRSRRAAQKAFLDEHFTQAKSSLTEIDFLTMDYESDEAVVIEPGRADTVREALRRIVEEWIELQGRPDQPEVSEHARLLPVALAWLQGHVGWRVPEQWLAQIAFRHPLRQENVCKYVLGREEWEANWRALTALSAMGRQSPWAKVWLLHAAEAQQLPGVDIRSDKLIEWARMQLRDRHELVRAEAGWLLAKHSAIRESEIAELFREATRISRPAVAAIAGRSSLAETSGVVKAIRRDVKLTQAGYKWGQG